MSARIGSPARAPARRAHFVEWVLSSMGQDPRNPRLSPEASEVLARLADCTLAAEVEAAFPREARDRMPYLYLVCHKVARNIEHIDEIEA